ncbi:MAG: extracellular solute-binding protein [Deltaproteobacteria bacterium]|nr:extracellular solute-binding protein [Deltaproteobacteria bacterium]
MKRAQAFILCAFTLLISQSGAHRSFAASIEDILASASREGALDFYGPLTIGPEGARQLGAAFNKKYGLNLIVKFAPSANMDRDLSRVITEAATGKEPEYDVMLVPDTYHTTLWLRKLHVPFDYRKLGVDPRVVHYDSATVSFANQFVLPAYNKKILPAHDVPKSWSGLLDPKWKGGKLGMTNATPAHFAALAAGLWGEEKTTKYVETLPQQGLNLGRLGEIYNRLLLGEVLVAITLTNSFIFTAEKTGAPIVFAEGVEPVISPAYHTSVLKGARHPMAGHLFAVFLTTSEAQQIWEKHMGHGSAFVPGTRAYQFAQGKQMLYMTQGQANLVEKLTRIYTKIVGFK